MTACQHPRFPVPDGRGGLLLSHCSWCPPYTREERKEAMRRTALGMLGLPVEEPPCPVEEAAKIVRAARLT